jgi:radical SAM protein with 4Fe4S-binding SPASM domain
MDVVLLFCQVMIDVGGIQLLDEVCHSCQFRMVCYVYCRAIHFRQAKKDKVATVSCRFPHKETTYL